MSKRQTVTKTGFLPEMAFRRSGNFRHGLLGRLGRLGRLWGFWWRGGEVLQKSAGGGFVSFGVDGGEPDGFEQVVESGHVTIA